MTPTPRRRSPAAKVPAEFAWEAPRPQDLVMTLLGTYMRGNHRTVWSGGLVALLGELGFSIGAARVSLTRLADRDLLARVREGRMIHYRLTPRAERVLVEGDRRIFGLGEVPAEVESWTIIWHKIPESQRPERGQLAKRLRFLGFGSLQDGLWVSPNDHEAELAQLIEELGISGRAGVFVGRLSQASAAEATLERAWDLDGLCRRYEAFVAEFAPYRRRRSLEEREAFLVRTRLVHLYRSFAGLDPGLPDRMMPRRRARAQAVASFDAIYAGLAEPAQRHFDRLATPSG